MAGRATVTTEPSMKAMLEPRMVAANTHGWARSAQPGVSAAAARMTPSSQGARPKLIIGCLVARLSKLRGQHGDLAARPQNPASAMRRSAGVLACGPPPARVRILLPSSRTGSMKLHVAHPEFPARIRVLRDPNCPHRPRPHRCFAGGPRVAYP